MNRKEARAQMRHELDTLHEDLYVSWFDKSVPDDWSGLDALDPVTRHKTRVTLRLDSDMVRWFRKLGPGYGPRMNRILRIYWAGLLSGQIEAYPGEDTLPRMQEMAMRDAKIAIEATRAITEQLRASREAGE